MWQYRILEAGFFHADGGAMFGAIPKRAWKRKYPADEDNCCILAMNCILLWNDDDRCILIDTGIGTKDLDKLSYYRFYDNRDIKDLVKDHGFNPEDITDVILSHLHFDHCGGCTYRDKTGNIKISFPNAIHHIGKKQWESYLNPNPIENGSFRKEDMYPFMQSQQIRLHESCLELYSGLDLDIYSGHTIGQLVPSFISNDEVVIFPGDVIPTKAHVPDEWISAHDLYPLESLVTKASLKEKVRKNQSVMVFYHDAYNKSLQYTNKV